MPTGASRGWQAAMLRQLGRLAPRLAGTLELSAAAGLHTSATAQGVGIPERRHPLGSHAYPGRFEGEMHAPLARLRAGLGPRCCRPHRRPPSPGCPPPGCRPVPQACSAAALT